MLFAVQSLPFLSLHPSISLKKCFLFYSWHSIIRGRATFHMHTVVQQQRFEGSLPMEMMQRWRCYFPSQAGLASESEFSIAMVQRLFCVKQYKQLQKLLLLKFRLKCMNRRNVYAMQLTKGKIYLSSQRDRKTKQGYSSISMTN